MVVAVLNPCQGPPAGKLCNDRSYRNENPGQNKLSPLLSTITRCPGVVRFQLST